ncbi:MobF family relaxase [Novosphingobium sp. TCA1]|uniref:MobF family relaxase n=1 Tax=Novosphingobium sp. TCA1 TaxID=2682474 RepID=UPI0013068835|nr:MobF family relaxase [Novosphingobium sp. TCA1]GFE77814.1 hypothetical protein NTCA1_54630 [Novosphingobium sp. TCA1]
MLSVASVKSAGGAASYFGKDDYYTGEHSSETSAWGGKGAEALGLSGEVKASAFEAILNGVLPDGTGVNQTAKRTIGTDLTFSMPKSASVMAYVAGDKRILDAHMSAVKETMSWVEKTRAEARDYSRTRNGEPVRTGNLVYAIFQHDTSRKLDPQGHLHVVIAAITKTAGGSWQALWNNPLWKNNSMIGSAYHAAFREKLSELGYDINLTGKHGQFEIAGVPKAVIEAFSQRRQDILEKAGQLGREKTDTESLREITKRTRDPKINLEDRSALREQWKSRAAALGFDGKALVEQAISRSTVQDDKPLGFVGKVQEVVTSLYAALAQYLRGSDSLTTTGLARLILTPNQLRTELAVASSVRHLGQREAAFKVDDVSKTALDFGIRGVTIDRVDARVNALIKSGQLIPGSSFTHVTTPEHLAQERKLLAGIDQGREASTQIVPASDVAERLQAHNTEHTLNPEQLTSATLALSTSDRIVVVQGVAGAGKTTLIQSIKALAAEEGKETVGLAFANKMVSMLRNEAQIKADTVSSFVNAHIKGALAGQGEAFEKSREDLAGKIFVLDESSLVANEAMNNLVMIANRLGVERLIMVGDRGQLQSIDAGKAFELIQAHKPAMSVMEISQRQKTPHMQQVAALGREGKFKEAFQVLGERVQSEKGNYLKAAAEKWLALSTEERERTALYASGRLTRGELNELVQEGLKTEGTITGDGLRLTTLQQVNATREELRYAKTYKEGHVLDVTRNSLSGGLSRGRYEVTGVQKGKVSLRDEHGKTLRFDPQNIDPVDKSDSIQLSEKMATTLHEGDRILWRANDKEREIFNSDQARVLSISEGHVMIENAAGKVLELDRSDKMLERLGLAYAINMHQAQGMTTDKGIGVVHSAESKLATQRLTYVMLTRVRFDMEIVTDNRDRLLETINANPGDKLSAMEVTGEKQLGGSMSSKSGVNASAISAANAGFNPTVPRELMNDAPNKEVELPERNIERSR